MILFLASRKNPTIKIEGRKLYNFRSVNSKNKKRNCYNIFVITCPPDQINFDNKHENFTIQEIIFAYSKNQGKILNFLNLFYNFSFCRPEISENHYFIIILDTSGSKRRITISHYFESCIHGNKGKGIYYFGIPSDPTDQREESQWKEGKMLQFYFGFIGF